MEQQRKSLAEAVEAQHGGRSRDSVWLVWACIRRRSEETQPHARGSAEAKGAAKAACGLASWSGSAGASPERSDAAAGKPRCHHVRLGVRLGSDAPTL